MHPHPARHLPVLAVFSLAAIAACSTVDDPAPNLEPIAATVTGDAPPVAPHETPPLRRTADGQWMWVRQRAPQGAAGPDDGQPHAGPGPFITQTTERKENPSAP
jgi:hypothetical protein